MPFHRLEGLQANLGIPLPSSTQWDVVENFAEEIEPAFGEFLRQAADGEIVHNDDTTVKILELMGERARQAALEDDGSAESADGSTESAKAKPLPIVDKYLQRRGRAIAKREHPAAEGILLQHVLA